MPAFEQAAPTTVMSLQVFLQAQLLGSEEFLSRQSEDQPGVDTSNATIGRCAWLSLLCEVLPRALLSELKLSRMLLGSSSAEQFLLVLAEEDISRANDFLTAAANQIDKLSGATLRLVWASTENLGAWPIARKRLDDALLAKTSSPLTAALDVQSFFAPQPVASEIADAASYFSTFAEQLPKAVRVGWSRENPARLSLDSGQYTWALSESSAADDEGILFPRRYAMDEAGENPSALAELASRADGVPHWGVLRGDVDQFEGRSQAVGSVEEHIHLSILFKEFFAGEISILCTLPEFWRKVSILYRGGDDFLVVGAWDSLLALARELERLFQKFAEHNMHAFPNSEGKTISMALAIAPEIETPLASVIEEAGLQLRRAKAVEPGTFYLFGRTLEWKRLNEAEELKRRLVRLTRDFGVRPGYIHDLASVYRESFSVRATKRGKNVRPEKPWRTYMRVSRVIPVARGKEFMNVRGEVIATLAGRKTAGPKLIPSARVGLEWARFAAAEK